MNWMARIVSSLRTLLQPERAERELDDELRFHLEMQTEANRAAGMSPEEARYAALRSFGGVEQVKELHRDERSYVWLEQMGRNLRFSLQMMRKDKGLSLTILLTLALGIGANTAIFTVAYATLLAPLPYPQPDRLVMVWSKLQGHRHRVSARDFVNWQRQSTAFEVLNAWTPYDFDIARPEAPEHVEGMKATPGYYGMLGNPLFLGRNFLPEEGEAGKEHVVILSCRLWRHLGANSRIIGQTMQMNGEDYTVVGVMAAGTADRWDEELIVPLVFKPEQLKRDYNDSREWFVTGRLKPGITIKQAQADVELIAANEASDYPESNQGWGALVEPLKNDFLPNNTKSTVWLLLASVGFLLLIACLNVANLLLAKGITRQREVAVRASLGARPAAIFTQFLTESLVLSWLGGLLGVAVGYIMLRGFIATMPRDALPPEADLRMNLPILLILLAGTTLAGVLFGCAPAWYGSRLDPAGVLKEGGRSGIGTGHHRLRRFLVIAEFALALPLLAGTGLAIHSFWNLTHIDLGVRKDHVLSFYLQPVSLLRDPKQIDSYYRRILSSIGRVPGVSYVCAMLNLPIATLHLEMPFTVAGEPLYADPSARPNVDVQMATPEYFQTFGIRIIRGRAFIDDDNASSPRVAMVNQVFANRFLRGTDPLRQRVLMEQLIPMQPKNGPTIEWQIVGIYQTVKSRGAREDEPEIATPFWQMALPIAGIGVRTNSDPAKMIKSIAAAVAAVDPETALFMPRTMEQVHDEVLANDRFTVILLASFAVVALLVAAVGIHGLTAFSVAQRSHEIALRMALGATRSRVVALVVKEALALACVGLGLGLLGTYFVGRAMQQILFGVGSTDFSSLGVVAFLLLTTALMASYLPARSAARIDPMLALRSE